MPNYLHEHKNFSDLIQIVADEKNILPTLIEKDYWIMHCLYGLKKAGYSFQLKGGTSLSKGYGIIHRFSEDIDIQIDPSISGLDVKTGRNHNKSIHCESRKEFYDWLGKNIQIDGIVKIERDYAFDDDKYRSGGIRLYYASEFQAATGVKEGVLLEVGFDDMIPNRPLEISSWTYDKAVTTPNIKINDNRVKGILCYSPAYTFVEKLQTIATKYRNQQATGNFPSNFLRHYYDIYCLLNNEEILEFIGTKEYKIHKEKRFPKADLNIPMSENEAFILSDPLIRDLYKKEYEKFSSLYYTGQIPFDEVIEKITANLSNF